MNIEYDGTVHALPVDWLAMTVRVPVCGTADISACEPALTTDEVTCWECKSIID